MSKYPSSTHQVADPRTTWLDRAAYVALLLTALSVTVVVTRPLWAQYRLSLYAVPTCQPAAPIPAHAMTANPFAKENTP